MTMSRLSNYFSHNFPDDCGRKKEGQETAWFSNDGKDNRDTLDNYDDDHACYVFIS